VRQSRFKTYEARHLFFVDGKYASTVQAIRLVAAKFIFLQTKQSHQH